MIGTGLKSKRFSKNGAYYLQGKKITNEIYQYGNFANDSNTDGIADGVLVNASTSESVSNNVQSFTATAQYGFIRIANTNSEGDIMYMCAKIKVQTGESVNLNISNATTYKQGQAVTADGNFQFTSIMRTALAGETELNPVIVENGTSGFQAIETKELHCINLTTIFGAGNEPTKGEMDTYMATRGYINF